jgi:hypothetical protein
MLPSWMTNLIQIINFLAKKLYTYLVFFKGKKMNNNNKEMISGFQTLQLNAVFFNFYSWKNNYN